MRSIHHSIYTTRLPSLSHSSLNGRRASFNFPGGRLQSLMILLLLGFGELSQKIALSFKIGATLDLIPQNLCLELFPTPVCRRQELPGDMIAIWRKICLFFLRDLALSLSLNKSIKSSQLKIFSSFLVALKLGEL